MSQIVQYQYIFHTCAIQKQEHVSSDSEASRLTFRFSFPIEKKKQTWHTDLKKRIF